MHCAECLQQVQKQIFMFEYVFAPPDAKVYVCFPRLFQVQ